MFFSVAIASNETGLVAELPFEEPYRILSIKEFIERKRRRINLQNVVKKTSAANINKRIYEPIPDLEPDPSLPKGKIVYPDFPLYKNDSQRPDSNRL